MESGNESWQDIKVISGSTVSQGHISLLLCMLIHLNIPARSCLSRAIGLVCTLSLYSLVERQNLPISRICIENQVIFFFRSKDTAPKFVINKWWLQLLFPLKCKAARKKQYLPPLLAFWYVRAHVCTDVCVETLYWYQHHKLEILLGSCQVQLMMCLFPSSGTQLSCLKPQRRLPY